MTIEAKANKNLKCHSCGKEIREGASILISAGAYISHKNKAKCQ